MNIGNRLRRSSSDRMIAGVCAGLADFFGLDVTLVRVIYTVATLGTAFAGGLVYLALWILIPQD